MIRDQFNKRPDGRAGDLDCPCESYPCERQPLDWFNIAFWTAAGIGLFAFWLGVILLVAMAF